MSSLDAYLGQVPKELRESIDKSATTSTESAKLTRTFDVVQFGADPTGVADSTQAFLTALASAGDEWVDVPAGTYLVSLSITDQAVRLRGAGILIHQKAKSVLTVTRTLGSPVAITSFSTVTLGNTSSTPPSGQVVTRINVGSVAGFGIGSVAHVTSQDSYVWDASGAGQSTWKAELCKLAGVCIDYDGATGSFSEQDIITGANASARVLGVTANGSAGTLYLTDVVGTFVDNENLQVGGTTIAVVNLAAYLIVDGQLVDTYTTSPVIRSYPEVPFEIDGLGIVCSGDQNSIVGSANRLPAFILTGVYKPTIRNFKIKSAWTRALQLWAAWMGKIDVSIESLPNLPALTEQGYGYGVEMTGCSSGLDVRVNGGNCRHAFTTNVTWTSTYGGIDYRQHGRPKYGTVHDSIIEGSRSAGLDTHIGGWRMSFVDCRVISGAAGGTTTASYDGFQDRSFGTRYSNCASVGGVNGFLNSSFQQPNDLPCDTVYENCIASGYAANGLNILTSVANNVGRITLSNMITVGDGAAVNTPYTQSGFLFGNGLKVDMFGCKARRFNNTPITIGGFSETGIYGCVLDYQDNPGTSWSPMRVAANSAIVNVHSLNIRQNTGHSSPSSLLRVNANVTGVVFNVGRIGCLNATGLTLLTLDSGATATVNLQKDNALSDGALADFYSWPVPTGRWFVPLGLGSGGTVVAVGNRKYAQPIVLPRATTIVALGVTVTSAATSGGRVQLGIHKDDGTTNPGALVYDAGNVTVDSTGDRTITLAQPQTLQGRYWLVALFENVATKPTVKATNVGVMQDNIVRTIGHASLSAATANTNGAGGITATQTFGALSDPFGTPTIVDGSSHPVIGYST